MKGFCSVAFISLTAFFSVQPALSTLPDSVGAGACLALSVACPAHGSAEEQSLIDLLSSSGDETANAVRYWLGQLNSPDWQTREYATQQLIALLEGLSDASQEAYLLALRCIFGTSGISSEEQTRLETVYVAISGGVTGEKATPRDDPFKTSLNIFIPHPISIIRANLSTRDLAAQSGLSCAEAIGKAQLELADDQASVDSELAGMNFPAGPNAPAGGGGGIFGAPPPQGNPRCDTVFLTNYAGTEPECYFDSQKCLHLTQSAHTVFYFFEVYADWGSQDACFANRCAANGFTYVSNCDPATQAGIRNQYPFGVPGTGEVSEKRACCVATPTPTATASSSSTSSSSSSQSSSLSLSSSSSQSSFLSSSQSSSSSSSSSRSSSSSSSSSQSSSLSSSQSSSSSSSPSSSMTSSFAYHSPHP